MQNATGQSPTAPGEDKTRSRKATSRNGRGAARASPGRRARSRSSPGRRSAGHWARGAVPPAAVPLLVIIRLGLPPLAMTWILEDGASSGASDCSADHAAQARISPRAVAEPPPAFSRRPAEPVNPAAGARHAWILRRDLKGSAWRLSDHSPGTAGRNKLRAKIRAQKKLVRIRAGTHRARAFRRAPSPRSVPPVPVPCAPRDSEASGVMVSPRRRARSPRG